MRRIVFLPILIVLLMAGCGGRGAIAPTPFPTAGPTATAAISGPIQLSITELLAAPGLYLDTVVQLTGRLQKNPLIVCNSNYYASPASWGLIEEGLMVAAGGFDDQVRSLLPGDLTMTVEGRWRRWEGTVGCGKQAQQQEVWYLSVERILSPSPLTQITLTPSSDVGIAAITAEATLPPSEGEFGEVVTETATLEMVETPVELESTEPPEANPGAPPPPLEGSSEITPTIPTAQTPITTPTTIPGTTPIASQTVPATIPPETGTPEATRGPGDLVNRGDIYDAIGDNFTISSLEAGAIDSWQVEISEGEKLFFQAIAPPPADIILSVYKGDQAVINNQNNAPAGAPEVLNAPPLPGPGIYTIRVTANGGVAAEYGLTIYDDPEYPVVIGGIITPGSPKIGVQLPPKTIQFWFFTAKEGDTVAIRLKPIGDVDASSDLYGPGGAYISTIDNNYEGEEEYKEVILTEIGLHAIRVFEYYITDPMKYDLDISFR